uniref:outer membrane beta-barrel protein n=1 Tax=Halomonas sp. TaxID=1486246 RepID=UPI0026293E77|nr:outer membrane beta-barrel protein [Halomonas sp.]
MKKRLALAAAFLVGACVTASSVQAEQWYVGGSAMFWDADDSHHSGDDDIGWRLNGGAQFNRYFAVEGQLGGGSHFDYLTGIYAKGILPLSQGIRLYGLAGLAEVDFHHGDDNDVSWGFGGELDLSPKLSLGADYMNYLDGSRYDFDAVSVGLRYRF